MSQMFFFVFVFVFFKYLHYLKCFSLDSLEKIKCTQITQLLTCRVKGSYLTLSTVWDTSEIFSEILENTTILGETSEKQETDLQADIPASRLRKF